MADTDRTLGTWIHRRARLGAGAVAVEVGERSVPYGMLAERIDLATTALADLGVLPGDRVAYSGPPGVAYLETLFAATSLGAAFTPINPVLPSEAAAWILDDAGPRVLVRAASSSLAVAASGSSDPTVVSIDDSAASDGVSWVFERTSAGGFRYLGRVEDVIQTAQGSVTTGQVERALEGQPGVAEVVGLGLPTADAFERPVAAVVAAPGASIDVASLEAAMSGMGGPLAGTRVVVVDAIPKSAAGKPQRDEVRRMVRSELGAALIAVERH